MNTSATESGLYDRTLDKSSCGVGFITRKDGIQTHDVLLRGHEALCAVPHRGGMSAEGVGDGAGVCVDLSVPFFRALTGQDDLEAGSFGVGNFFLPTDVAFHGDAEAVIERALADQGFQVLLERDVPVDATVLRPAAIRHQLPIRQWVFTAPDAGADEAEFDRRIHDALLAIEAVAYTQPDLAGLYPLSLSARTQVLKGRLNSNEVMPYFQDLVDPAHAVHTLYFHTRFSTNTDPHPTMAQPFRLMAHNGELNTDKKNRLSEAALARARNREIVRPHGQSDSCRLDQTLQSRVVEDGLDLVTAVVSMMPPAWENDSTLSPEVRAMLEYFSLYEEKNDGPAALIFGDGTVVGARLDRLGLRPLRSVETDEYLCVTSEAGQIDFDPATVLHRGRIEAGGMLYFDHREGRAYSTDEALELLASRTDYVTLVADARRTLDALPEVQPEPGPLRYKGDLDRHQRFVAYSHNQESFKFMMDPMLASGQEKISAMGYGNAINALSDQEGGVAKYFSQRFAQVTNPSLDSIREADGMTLRVALGAKPNSGARPAPQIVVPSPILTHAEALRIRKQTETPVERFSMLYTPVQGDAAANAAALEAAVSALCDDVEAFAREHGGIAVVTDRHVSTDKAALPMIVVISALNQRLIEEGLRLRVSVVAESGQISSSHHVAAALGFGAAAVYPLAVRLRAEEKFADEADVAFKRFAKAAEKSLMKTMGRVGLCTAESYIGGEFFEPNYLDTDDPILRRWFPNVQTPVGGVGFAVIAQAVADWHARAVTVSGEKDIPLLGLFKERAEGAGHSYGTAAVRGFVDLTEEPIAFDTAGTQDHTESLRLLPLNRLEDAFGLDDDAYRNAGFQKLTHDAIDRFEITPGYRAFARTMADERTRRPAALRDVLDLPADVTFLTTAAEFRKQMGRFSRKGNNSFAVRGLASEPVGDDEFRLRLTGPHAGEARVLAALGESLVMRFGDDLREHRVDGDALLVRTSGEALRCLSLLRTAPPSVPLAKVQKASEITPFLTSGAMSHGALNSNAHEAVAHGTNMVGGMSNSGEGGEHISRYGTIRGSRIKQFASGRFGVWAGYLADPMLEELEIKIAQGAKPGEGGQLPAPKVTVEIAAARGGTPGVELVSPPPHHDTYSIEDLAQLIHDCKAARVRVIVKLVSSEGIGTIAVGVAKAGADVINVAGNTGGTGAAAVTSLKYAGRSAEIGVAEVHQALCANGLRQKVLLRCSGAHQTASDVVKSALLGADSFEFGTTALMMLKCVMAKNCNVKCPAGLTTNPELFDGDPRAMAQYLLNIAHETREVLAELGMSSLREARGRSDLLQLLDHPSSVGQLDLRAMLAVVEEVTIGDPVYLEKDYTLDDGWLVQLRAALVEQGEATVELGDGVHLSNRNKSVGAQLAVDIERMLNHELTDAALPAVLRDERGRGYLREGSVRITTSGSAGLSYGAFCNDGMTLVHTGTANDGVGKGANGGSIVVRSPGGGSDRHGGNVLIGNFALFGATGGRTFVEGQAGDRFAVRNSGATAVVEGVGDFACEYMTNGAVLNLGGFGKGVGNGMSGGFVYQYDPENKLPGKASADSILLGSITGDDEHAALHRQAVHVLLGWHLEATGSAKAAWLLENWETEQHHFVYGMPRALLQYQDSGEILKAKPRKDLADELAAALVAHQVRKFKLDYRDGRAVQDGAVPGYGETDTEAMFALLNNYTVLNAAQEMALSKLPGVTDLSDPAVDKAVRNLLLTEDFFLIQRLQRYAREALKDYSDEDLAVMVAAKRLADYKDALRRRNVRSIDAPGTYGWILHQDAKNVAKIGRLPGFEELFAQHALPDLIPARDIPTKDVVAS
ncbi:MULTISPECIES: glutamate synthase-related protein [unclassified Rhodococcus (in: high G+C Gram-positive bacteria)]|uniref:glutamate synthase-related protein n=1 Tax=unclassified Rhodococcus (in: high G+C Gram-positive bacteria) TaxID=192944 RepID=UPI00163AADC3|nr:MULTISPECIES: glutamate synthase-related protein [unclassified Rhodococcus (in: high G+C Gram-positive bacteria)]MBC2639167.1 glutamate synthase large subunit [Rhodococcus sp. 3A]MBC2896090.1 glutamate synthase large subunit [Rhodococcus sp. 4CII]